MDLYAETRQDKKEDIPLKEIQEEFLDEAEQYLMLDSSQKFLENVVKEITPADFFYMRGLNEYDQAPTKEFAYDIKYGEMYKTLDNMALVDKLIETYNYNFKQKDGVILAAAVMDMFHKYDDDNVMQHVFRPLYRLHSHKGILTKDTKYYMDTSCMCHLGKHSQGVNTDLYEPEFKIVHRADMLTTQGV